MTARDDWDKMLSQIMPNFVTRLAEQVIRDQDTEIAGLKRELDAMHPGRQVWHCMSAVAGRVMIEVEPEARDGDMIRYTDTGAEFVYLEGSWIEQER